MREFDHEGYRWFLDDRVGRPGYFAAVIKVEEVGFGGVGNTPLVAKITQKAGVHREAAEQEIRVFQAIGDSPHVVSLKRSLPLLDERFGEFLGCVAAILERGDTSLKELLEAGPIRPEEMLEVAFGVAQGLESMHSAGYAHGDLHPGNVIRTRAGWKVADLNAAQRIDRSTGLAKASGTPGSPVVWSPERRQENRASKPDDVWAWGVLVLLLQKPVYPFPTEQPISLDHVDPAVGALPEPLRLAAYSALQPNPAQRGTAADLVNDLGPRRHRSLAGGRRLEAPTSTLATLPPTSPDIRHLGWGTYRRGQIEVVGVRDFRAVHCWSLDDGRSWSGWLDFEMGEGVVGAALSTMVEGHLEVFAVLADGSVTHRWLIVDPTTDRHAGWSDLYEFRSARDSRATAVATGSIGPGHQEVLAVDENGALWSRWWWHRSPWEWSEWTPWQVPDVVVAVSASAYDRDARVSNSDGVVVATTRSGERLARTWKPGNFWRDWQEVDLHVVPTRLGLVRTTGRTGTAVVLPDGRRRTLDGDWIGLLPDGRMLTLVEGVPAVT